jgi:multidrug efflux pump subunit AcrA (membrane-fusion protein)
LFHSDKDLAVWVFDPEKSTVNLRPIKVLQYHNNEIFVVNGLANGERVVIAGVQKLWPGMRTRLP